MDDAGQRSFGQLLESQSGADGTETNGFGTGNPSYNGYSDKYLIRLSIEVIFPRHQILHLLLDVPLHLAD
jgi:hypothetical protein